MAGTTPSGNKHPDQVLLDQKKKITEMVRLRFARYGDDTLAIMLGYAFQPTRMPTLLERLEMRVSTQNFADQLDAISNWVNEWGSAKFKQRALAEKKKEIEPIQLGALDQAIIVGEEPQPPMDAPPMAQPAMQPAGGSTLQTAARRSRRSQATNASAATGEKIPKAAGKRISGGSIIGGNIWSTPPRLRAARIKISIKTQAS